MAKLTVYFKNSVVCSHLFETETVHIGRDETNDLIIDSPEFATAHAVIVTRNDSCIIKQLNDSFPLIINGKNIEEGGLRQGDTITVGQHDIVYNINNAEQPAKSSKKTVVPASRKVKSDYISHVANYQVISGVGMGKIFHLDSQMTLLGEQGSGIVIISKRKNGYFASILEDAELITLNDQPLGDKTVKLNHDDVLAIGDTVVHFYLH